MKPELIELYAILYKCMFSNEKNNTKDNENNEKNNNNSEKSTKTLIDNKDDSKNETIDLILDIFRLNESDPSWIKIGYSIYIPICFNFLNSSDFSDYKKYIHILMKEKHRKTKYDRLEDNDCFCISRFIAANTNISISNETKKTFKKTINYNNNDDDNGDETEEQSETQSNTIIPVLNLKNEQEEEQTTSQKSEKESSVIDFNLFKKNDIQRQMLVKFYAKFLYTFGLVIVDFDKGK